jgi:hypothetical protein
MDQAQPAHLHRALRLRVGDMRGGKREAGGAGEKVAAADHAKSPGFRDWGGVARQPVMGVSDCR